jgi:uncharacterized protein (TIGR00251 family)
VSLIARLALPESTDLHVRLTPRADREAVVLDGELVRARVSAPPVGGQANMALVKLLARALGVSKSRLTIVRGETARDKLVRVEGLAAADAHDRLAKRRSR